MKTLYAIAVLAFAVFLLYAVNSYARGTYPPGPIADWFKSQHNASGQWCCDQADGHPFYGDYKVNADGSVDVTDDNGKVYHINKSMVLQGPNPVGAPVWWYLTYDGGGVKYTYCFALGSGS